MSVKRASYNGQYTRASTSGDPGSNPACFHFYQVAHIHITSYKIFIHEYDMMIMEEKEKILINQTWVP